MSTFDGTSVSFDLAAGQGIACQFANRIAETTLRIVKDDTGDSGVEFLTSVFQGESQIAESVISDDGVSPLVLEVGVVAWADVFLMEVVPSTFTWDSDATTCVSDLLGEVGQAVSERGDKFSEKLLPAGSPATIVAGAINIDDDNVRPGDTITCTLVNDPMPGAVRINKVTTDGADPQDFAFSTTGGLTPAAFALDTDTDATNSSMQSFASVPVGTYTVSEAAIDGYVTTVACSEDPGDGNSVASGSTATINVGPGELVVCTFTSTKIPIGSIVLVLDTDPNGPQDFSFTAVSPAIVTASTNTSNLTPAFLLDDDDDPTLGNTLTFTGEIVGTTVTQEAVAGFTTTVSCVDPDGGSTNGSLTATIDLDEGESITCTFVNTAVVEAVVDNTGGGGAVSAGSPVDTTAADAPAAAAASPAAAAQAVSAAQPLAVTGVDSLPLAQLGFAILGIGVSVAAAGRHRRSTRFFD